MTAPKLTIGMAHFRDFNGAYFTVQALRMFHDCRDVEFLIVDNDPGSPDSELLKGQLGHGAVGNRGYRLIEMAEPKGTTQPRNRVFDEATGDAVLCCDSHVLPSPDSIRRLLKFYSDNPATMDLYSGPMLYDNLMNYTDHFDDQWRGGMWGTWGTSWGCSCGNNSKQWLESEHTLKFATVQEGEFVQFVELALIDEKDTDKKDPSDQKDDGPLRPLSRLRPLSFCQFCNKRLPTNLPWPAHELALLQAGYIPLAGGPDNHPFEIPAQGLGLFTCRREAWLGFSREFRQFGGEEMYIHHKYKQAGRKTVCLPFLRWGHRFGRPGGATYPLTSYGKVRNYVIGLQELGLPLDRLKEHFVRDAAGHDAISEADWAWLLKDPIGNLDPPEPEETEESCPTCGGAQPMPPEGMTGLAEIATWLAGVPRDLNEHLPALAALAAQCDTVVEFSHRRESVVALLAGLLECGDSSPLSESQPAKSGDESPRSKKLLSHCLERDRLPIRLRKQFPDVLTIRRKGSDQVAEIPPCDLLFLDPVGHADPLLRQLKLYSPAVSVWIAIHDTAIFGEQAPGGNAPGLLPAIRVFLAENPAWFVSDDTERQYGLTVLSRDPVDRPAEPLPRWPLNSCLLPDHGPGTELKKLLAVMGIVPGPGCECNARAAEMDVLGVEGCRRERETILGWLREGQARWGWLEKVTAAAKAVASGLACRLSITDPYGSLVDEAIRLAELAKNPE